MKKWIAVLVLATLAGSVFCFYLSGRAIWVPIYQKLTGKRTVADAITEYGPAAESRLKPFFDKANVTYTPANISLIALKEEKVLELWAKANEDWILVKTYEVKKASGTIGPKLLEGDQQVPEGFYQIEALNPNSTYHLSLKLNYPNEFDRLQAELDGRTKLGGDIFIHGKAVSIGCLAMGDEAIEEIFVLADRVGKNNISVIIAPYDFRERRQESQSGTPPWTAKLYLDIERELYKFKS